MAVDGHVENDGIGVLGLNVDLALEEGCVGDDILTVHHGVAGTCGVDFVVGVVDQVDHFTRIQLGGILHPGVNGCPMDIRSIRHFQHGIPGLGIRRHVEIQVLEITQVLNCIALGGKIQGVAGALGGAIAAVEAHHGAQ